MFKSLKAAKFILKNLIFSDKKLVNLEHIKHYKKNSTEDLRLIASLWLKIIWDIANVRLYFQLCKTSSISRGIFHNGFSTHFYFLSLGFIIILGLGKIFVLFFKSPWNFTQNILALLWIKEETLNHSRRFTLQTEVSFCHTIIKSLDIFSIFPRQFN